MTKFFFLNLFLFFVIVSCKESREDRIKNYLSERNIHGNVAIGILNPNSCGSCTDYSIDWLCKKNTSGRKKTILTTGTLDPNYKTKLADNGYSFISVDQNNLTRVGITLTVCTYIEMTDGEITLIKSVK